MKNFELSLIAEKYGINIRALKRTLKEDGVNRKTATRYEVFRSVFVHCTDLIYCRQSEFDGTVEYLNPLVSHWLVEDMKSAEKEVEL
jgi:hypothetical protein